MYTDKYLNYCFICIQFSQQHRHAHRSQLLQAFTGIILLINIKCDSNNFQPHSVSLFLQFSNAAVVCFPIFLKYKMASAHHPSCPALPLCCTNSSSVLGDSQLMTHPMSEQSTPKPNTLVAITNLKLLFTLQNSARTLALLSSVDAAVKQIYQPKFYDIW